MAERQREEPQIDRYTPRRRNSWGGPPPAPRPRTLAPGLDTELARYPGTLNDVGIAYHRLPTYEFETTTSGRSNPSWVDWTSAGPIRAELRMVNSSLRRQSGTSNTRSMVDPNNWQRGLHTNPTPGVVVTAGRYQETQQMIPARQYRLRSGQYTGQSFSETTKIQGGA